MLKDGDENACQSRDAHGCAAVEPTDTSQPAPPNYTLKLDVALAKCQQATIQNKC